MIYTILFFIDGANPLKRMSVGGLLCRGPGGTWGLTVGIILPKVAPCLVRGAERLAEPKTMEQRGERREDHAGGWEISERGGL